MSDAPPRVRWLYGIAGGVALVGVAWFVAYWYFGLEETEMLGRRAKVAALLQQAQTEGEAAIYRKSRPSELRSPLLKSYTVQPDGRVELLLTGHAELEAVRVSAVPLIQADKIVAWECRSESQSPSLPRGCRLKKGEK